MHGEGETSGRSQPALIGPGDWSDRFSYRVLRHTEAGENFSLQGGEESSDSFLLFLLLGLTDLCKLKYSRYFNGITVDGECKDTTIQISGIEYFLLSMCGDFMLLES